MPKFRIWLTMSAGWKKNSTPGKRLGKYLAQMPSTIPLSDDDARFNRRPESPHRWYRSFQRWLYDRLMPQ